MSASDFLHLPTPVKALVLMMFFPAIWAGSLAIGAIADDVIRWMQRKTPPRQGVENES